MLPYSIETVLSLFGYGCYLQHPFPGFHKVDLWLYSLIILCESPLCQKFKYITQRCRAGDVVRVDFKMGCYTVALSNLFADRQ